MFGFWESDKVFYFVVARVVVDMVDIETIWYWAVVFLPNVDMKPYAVRLTVSAFFLAQPIAFSVLIKSLSIVLNVSDGSDFFLNFHMAPPFDIVTITYRNAKVNSAVRYMLVKSIKPAGIEPVYNMTVEEYHNYLIHGGVILKNCDAARYFAVTRTLGAERVEVPEEPEFEDDAVDYDEEMTGGDMTDDYMAYGGD